MRRTRPGARRFILLRNFLPNGRRCAMRLPKAFRSASWICRLPCALRWKRGRKRQRGPRLKRLKTLLLRRTANRRSWRRRAKRGRHSLKRRTKPGRRKRRRMKRERSNPGATESRTRGRRRAFRSTRTIRWTGWDAPQATKAGRAGGITWWRSGSTGLNCSRPSARP